jgi:TolA-binding protein
VSNLRVVDLHPEDLLERDAIGELDESERARLDSHLARCSTCRFERQLRADFTDELAGDDLQPGPLALIAEVAESGPSLARDASSVRVSGDDMSAPPPRVLARPRSRRTARAVWLLAAASLVLIAGGAAAALGEQRWARMTAAPQAAATVPADVGPVAARANGRRLPVPAPATLASEVEVPADVAVNAAVDSSPAQPIVRARTARTEGQVVAETGPAQLFDAETTARRHGDYSRVYEIHRELGSRFGRSREAQVSRATVGHLLLDRGDPAGALTNFDAYLSTGSGNLGEEAMIGRATALERLGRTQEASLAWRALVVAFPDTPYAAHAKARAESFSGN